MFELEDKGPEYEVQRTSTVQHRVSTPLTIVRIAIKHDG